LKRGRRRVTARRHPGPLDVEAAARADAKADRADRRAAAAKGQLRAGEASAQPAKAEIESGQGEAALGAADQLVPFGLYQRADLPLDSLE